MNFWNKFIAVVLLCVPLWGQAVEVENLYTGKILVTDKTQKNRVKAHRWAIEQVLTKVTGSREILKNIRIQQEVRLRTANYIKSYAFVTDDQQRTFLVDEFDQVKIDNLLRGVGASIWGKRRPETFVWLALEEGVHRNILTTGRNPQYSEMLLQSADDRGLPVVVPDQNVVAQSQLYSSDVWARFERVVYNATSELGYEHYIMARLYYDESQENGQGWSLEYVLMEGMQQQLKNQLSGEDLGSLKEMLNQVGDYFAAQYAIKSEGLGIDDVEVVITDLANVVDLVKAEAHLESLPPVAGVELTNFESNQARFRLTLSGQGLDVIKAMALLDEFEQRIVVDEVAPVKALSVDEQLELLTQEYLKQINPQESEAGSQQGPKQIRLNYRWLGAQ